MEIPGKASDNTITDSSFALIMKNKESDFEFPRFPHDNPPWSFETSKPDIESHHKEQAQMSSSSTTDADYYTKFHTRENFAEQHRMKGKFHECEVCGKVFNHRGHLNEHNRIHMGEKPYKCKVCGKGFSRNSQLNVHKRMHTGEKPHKCKVCGKSYADRRCLIVHTRKHTGEMPFECDICGTKFRSSQSLARHKKIYSHGRPYEYKLSQGRSKDVTTSLHIWRPTPVRDRTSVKFSQEHLQDLWPSLNIRRHTLMRDWELHPRKFNNLSSRSTEKRTNSLKEGKEV